MDTDRRQTWVRTGASVVKLNISPGLPSIDIGYEREIISLLNSLRTFSIGAPPGILLTEILFEGDPIRTVTTLSWKKEKKYSVYENGIRLSW